MYGIFVNEKKGGVKYAQALAYGYKTAESRNKDMLSKLVGKRVAVIRTMANHAPEVVGYVTITKKEFCSVEKFHEFYNVHLVPPGSGYDATARGKWLYYVADPEPCKPYTLPVDAVRHGRSYCEF